MMKFPSGKIVLDVLEDPFCITNIKKMLDTAGKDESFDIMNLSKDELNLMKAALDTYCNVGERINGIENALALIFKRLEVFEQTTQKNLQDLINEMRNPSLTYTQQPYSGWTTSVSNTSSTLSPYEVRQAYESIKQSKEEKI